MQRATRPTREQMIREAVRAADAARDDGDFGEERLATALLREIGATTEEIKAVYMSA